MDRRSWTQQEDQAIVSLVDEFGVMDWTNISQKLKERYNINERTGKQCRERWYNHLNPQVNKKPWTDEEEKLLFQIHRKSGNKWKLMSRYFEGRTDNDIKNHFYSTLRRSLRRLNKFIGQKNSTTQMREIKPSVLSTIMNYIYEQENNIETNIVDSLKDLPYLIFEFSNYKPVKSKVKLQEDEQMKSKINFIFTLITKANNTYQVLKQNSKAVKNSKRCNSNNNTGGMKSMTSYCVTNNNNDNNKNFINCQTINYNNLQQQIHTAVQIAAPQEKSISSSSTTNTNKSSIYNANTNNQCRIDNSPNLKQQNNKINQHYKQQQQQLDFIKYLPKKSNSPLNLSLQLSTVTTTPIKKVKQKTVKILKKPDYSSYQTYNNNNNYNNNYNNNNNNNYNNKMDTQYLQRGSIIIDNNNIDSNINNMNNNKDLHTELIQDNMQLQLLQQSHHSDFFTKRDYYQSQYNISNTKQQQQRQSTQNLQQLTYLRTRRISLEAYEDFMQDQDIGQLQQPSQVGFYYPTGSLDDLVVVGKQVVIHQVQHQSNVLIDNNQVKVQQNHSDDHSNIDELIEMNYSRSH